MPIPEFVADLRAKIGPEHPLWLAGSTAVIIRPRARAGDLSPVEGSRPAGEAVPADEEVLLVRRSDNGVWSPVTGIVDPGEHPATAAVRESLEEAMVEVRVDRLVRLSVSPKIVHATGDRAQYCDLVFRCTWVSGEAAVGDDESVDVAWFPVDALPAMPEHLASRVAVAVADRPECELLVDGVALPIVGPNGNA
ncbi:8-oxo-dGTP pyrophosphatase MutT (NUDIX family) [Pseudoclavibacter sp. JAI123]|uniref:NUDIX hydrolase n=1 Tax=Pseudoclavibacter sp. JAI123 TaxID=2723065 RepID=UPI0015CBB9E1|nr:NUDIX domain-containing protein [Pseudoclavibacter sp. JAI123]NYF12077.1 8-oxo-dGTP pyrophosphatase MutT (NUDIX family) [Pseudoclavibacter sp. JAI123]